MKRFTCVVGFVVVASCVNAQMVVLEGVGGETLTTGDLLDGIDNTGITTNVVEVPGLEISARSGATNQDINVTVESLGITIFNSGDNTDAFDAGEKLIISFNKELRINRLDFNQFTADESITVSVGGVVREIHDLDLTHRISDYLDTNIVVEANSEIEFYTTGSSDIGLDGIDVTVVESIRELELSFSRSNGVSHVAAIFNETATTNYVLQSCTNLASNDWNTVSLPFSEDTNWPMELTNGSGFYRAIAE